jgi:IS1 family transposase
MNKLPISKRTQIVQLLVEGMSLRSISRVADVSINTVTKLLVEVGSACEKFHDEQVVNLNSKRVQCDEIWSFVYAKDKNVDRATAAPEGAGDAWTFTAIDADSKLVVSWFVGSRDIYSAEPFMRDVASRIKNRVQLTTDGFKPYLKAVDAAFDGDIDFAQLIKIYGTPQGEGNEKRYSPAECTGSEKKIIEGRPDAAFISTSYVERQNLTMRMHMRRFTRLTNAFSKKVENHCYAIALHFVYYNFCKVHKTLRVTPAMEAKLMSKPMSIEGLVRMAYAEEIAKEEAGRLRKVRPQAEGSN